MLFEADAKRIIEERGLPVPPGRQLLGGDDLPNTVESAVAIKAQLLSGGRGKAGLIRLATRDEAVGAIADVRAAMIKHGHHPVVMVEGQVQFSAEHYLAWRIDDVRRCFVLMFSMNGGVEIEAHADSVYELHCNPLEPVRQATIAKFLADAGLKGRALASVARFATELHAVLVGEDAVLIEINPLAITPAGAVVALDAKMALDDSADGRHLDRQKLATRDWQSSATDPIEKAANEAGFAFVRLPGEVALVTGGAGIGMTLVDLLGDAGLSAANFVDLPGGSGARVFGDLTRLVLQRAAEPDVKAMIIFLTLSATSLKQPVESILQTLDQARPQIPIVVGIVAGGSAEREMTLAEAQSEFRRRGYECVTELDAAVSAVVKAIGG